VPPRASAGVDQAAGVLAQLVRDVADQIGAQLE
jgi:hypothetical protein